MEISPPPPPDLEGFRLERSLGRGATAEVWLATDALLERPVALKIAHGPASADARARFLLEARAVARIHHPNLMAIHSVGEVDERPFLVTELLVGTSLAEMELPVDPERALAIALDLSRGLVAAHRAGVLHRDIKPANVFACTDGRVKLIDFGLAKLADRSPADGGGVPPGPSAIALAETVPAGLEIVGTPLYMAPETWRGEAATQYADVYSLGALTHELLSGRPPFVADTVKELRELVLSEASSPPPLPAGLLYDLVRRCLARDPRRRPSSEELRDALETLAGDAAAPPDEAPLDPGANPYRGLLSFGREHRALFFGREHEVGAVLAELAWAPFVLVVGPSGAGKSSLVRAGVAPRVEAGALGPGPWRVVTVVPGRRPLEALAHALGPGLELDQLAARSRGQRVLVIADQLEELWTLADREERRRFAAALAALVRAAPGVRVIATLRSDFLSRLEDLGELRTWALPATVVLRPLAPAGLRSAIREPALRLGVELEDALVEHLADGTSHGSLPLLSFALARLWERRDPASARITTAVLGELGGLEGALAAHADRVLAGLAEGPAAAARRLLLGLVTVEGTRARREEAELLRDDPVARAALAALVEGRLVVASEGEEGAAFEVAHEALIAGWPTLAGWLAEEASAREAAERIGRATAEWRRLGGGREGLWAAAQLRGLVEPAQLGEAERAFLRASRRAAGRTRRSRRALLLGLPVALAVLAAATWTTSSLRRRAAVATALAAARARWAAAEEAAGAAATLRGQAMVRFDRDELGPAEDLWRRTLAEEERADGLRKEVGGDLERALTLDPRDPAARSLYADATLASLLAGERHHQAALVAALRSRLALYDDGSRAARLAAPAHLRIETSLGGARLVLSRYIHDAGGRLVPAEPRPIAAGEDVALAPGSYLVVAELEGRWSTRAPFVLERGEERRLRVVLPPADAVPAGMIYVPAGRFRYGSDDDEETRALLTHQPGHDVDLAAFLIARTEVTNADYDGFLRGLSNDVLRRRQPVDWRPGRAGDVPVDKLSRDSAEAYAAWLAQRVPGARLCTDREWERAARGADGRRLPHGDLDHPRPEEACTLFSYGRDPGRGGPCPVGAHPASASPFGVEDMSGNVWEWVSGAADRAHPELGIIRGGGWLNDDLTLWITNRGSIGPEANSGNFGIRICADAPDQG